MIQLKTIECAEINREQLVAFKQYASVPDDTRDALLKILLHTAMKQVQKSADKSLLPGTFEVTCSERDTNDAVRMYQTVSEVLSVTDGNGAALDYTRNGAYVQPNKFTDTVIIRYRTAPVLPDADALLPVVLQYATALYDGESTDTLSSILAQC